MDGCFQIQLSCYGTQYCPDTDDTDQIAEDKADLEALRTDSSYSK
ncbi:hypothetical protein [Myroides sp. LJL110]